MKFFWLGLGKTKPVQGSGRPKILFLNLGVDLMFIFGEEFKFDKKN
jgi:hypothetical protein